MPQSINEGRYMEEFLFSEGNGNISRETITVASGQNLAAGTPFQLSGGKAVVATGAVNTAGAIITAVEGVISKAVDATGGDVLDVPYIARNAEVVEALLAGLPGGTTQKNAIKASLKAKDIIYR